MKGTPAWPALAIAIIVPACANGGDDSQSHGPSFYDAGKRGPDATLDAPVLVEAGGGDVKGDAPPDSAATDAPNDSSDSSDSSIPDAGDSAVDSPPDAPADGSSCTSTVAIMGGSATTAFGVTSVGGSTWSVSPLAGNVASMPSLV